MINFDDEITINGRELEDLIDKGIKKYYYDRKRFGSQKQKQIKDYILEEIEFHLIFKQVRS
jgi:hypothetical protein